MKSNFAVISIAELRAYEFPGETVGAELQFKKEHPGVLENWWRRDES